jgi:hypothetical protein
MGGVKGCRLRVRDAVRIYYEPFIICLFFFIFPLRQQVTAATVNHRNSQS